MRISQRSWCQNDAAYNAHDTIMTRHILLYTNRDLLTNEAVTRNDRRLLPAHHRYKSQRAISREKNYPITGRHTWTIKGVLGFQVSNRNLTAATGSFSITNLMAGVVTQRVANKVLARVWWSPFLQQTRLKTDARLQVGTEVSECKM